MEEYARVNAARAPMLKWSGGVPFGWNSWGKIQTKLNYSTAVATTDFFAGDMRGRHFENDGVDYINLDSFWDNMSASELRRFVDHAHTRGMRAGIYWTPFAYWGTDLARPVEGSQTPYSEVVLRGRAGAPLSLDGAIALDPTHPATRKRMDVVIGRLRALHFDYIKLDFLTHGALEGGCRNGIHYDPAVQTGIQAYNSGMRYLLKRIGGTMFISASIAPLFPYGYAHARRVSCDTFGAISETEYAMNSIGYGWWMSGTLYAFNDPDHIVLEGHTPSENQSRVTSAAIAGTVFLSGDDVTRAPGRERVERWLTNSDINRVARLGRAFRPVEGNTGTSAPRAMALRDGHAWYLAVFNYDSKAPATASVDLGRAGLDAARPYHVTDLWSGRQWDALGSLSAALRPAESTILRLEPGAG
jgi:hypothetical protein